MLTGVLAAFFNLDQLVHMMSIGTLMAYSIVAACVMILRFEVEDESEKSDPTLTPITDCRSFLHCLWNMDKATKPTKQTAQIVTIEVTAFCTCIISCNLCVFCCCLYCCCCSSYSRFD